MSSPTNVVLAQVSRGIAPVASIAEAVQQAAQQGWTYVPILGYPLVEAKNRAAQAALDRQADLLLMEDDICTPPDVWDALATVQGHPDIVAYARARVRGGGENVYTTPDGDFLYTGNCFTWVPYAVLSRLARPIFEARRWSPERDAMDVSPRSLQPNGIGSDTGFWYHVRHLTPAPRIQELGTVTHLKHPLNIQRNNVAPCEVSVW